MATWKITFLCNSSTTNSWVFSYLSNESYRNFTTPDFCSSLSYTMQTKWKHSEQIDDNKQWKIQRITKWLSLSLFGICNDFHNFLTKEKSFSRWIIFSKSTETFSFHELWSHRIQNNNRCTIEKCFSSTENCQSFSDT